MKFQRTQNKSNDSQILKKQKNYKQTIKKKGQPLYNIDKIVDRKIMKNKIYYKVRWEGYSSKNDTWEPYVNLKMDKVQQLIDDYEEKQGQKFQKTKHDDIIMTSFSETDSEDSQSDQQLNINDKQQDKINKQDNQLQSTSILSNIQQQNQTQNQQIEIEQNNQEQITNQECIAQQEQTNISMTQQDQIQQEQTNLDCTNIQQTNNSLQDQTNLDCTNNQQTQQTQQEQLEQSIQDLSFNDDQKYENHLGSFKNNDKVNQILSLKKDEFTKDILFKIEWKKRKNGYQPSSTWVQNIQLKKNYSQLMFKFYESKIKFIDN